MSKITDAREAVMVGRRTDGSLVRRPLSPHLQAYDMMQMTSALSITHRITGALWSVGMVFLVWWLVAAASGEEALVALHDAARLGEAFSICLIDQNMPRMDGWRLASEITGDTAINGARLILMVPEGTMGGPRLWPCRR